MPQMKDMTLDEAHESNVKGARDGVATGVLTQDGADFLIAISLLVKNELARHGLSVAHFSLFMPQMAELGMHMQGLLDTEAKRETPAALRFMFESLQTMAKITAFNAEKRAGSGVPGLIPGLDVPPSLN